MAFHEAVQAVITVCTMKCIENDRARSERRRLAVSPYLAHPVLTNPQWRLWTLVRPAGLTMGPCCQERGFLQTHLCQRNVRGSEPRTLHRPRPWMTCGLATSLRRYFKSIFFFLSFFLPSLGNSRLLLARSCERQRQNSSLMGRLWLDTRVLFFRTSPWE